MRYISLTPQGPVVSRICIGSVFYGTTVPQKTVFEQLDYFYHHGGNFIDTAHVYADWLPNGQGASEIAIGAWLKERKIRDKIIISTKGAHPNLKTMDIPRMGRAEVRQDLEESLGRLGTDWVDLYFLHRDDASRPVEEILFMLEEFKKEGKIIHYGCSNWKRERLEEADSIAARKGWDGFICNQLMWGIGDINWQGLTDKSLVAMDAEIYEYHTRSQKAVMAYSSSCKGYFSKKIKNLPVTQAMEAVYGAPSNDALLRRLPDIERETGVKTAVIVSAYIMAQEFPSIPIASFSSLSQMDEGMAACDFDFPPELLKEIRQSRAYVVY
ncbi:MAG: aldo/keto reductase [Treponema sp.]|jgi:aryl-alcohol dehydrogenase-like predicted oxidoreductase|nr:aldo/keto reductase [Treponema sp.]